jgi:molybdenum cofactor synthesis domain-containing protein
VKSAFGRVSAQDVVSPINVPDSPRSHMDGYAVVASDLRGASQRAPRTLALRGNLRVLENLIPRISSGETMAVVTGGPLPVGADAVVPVEQTKRAGQKVVFAKQCQKGDFCFPTGADVSRGETVIIRGETIRAQDVGILVLIGVTALEVYARPRVALIATGSELTEALTGQSLKVRESHTPIFENLIRESGGEPFLVGIIPDDVGRIGAAVEQAADDSDLILTLGGTSLGERDLVERAMRRASKSTHIIHGIRMDRGRVSGLAEVKGKPVVMMPGPIQGAMNAFALFGIPTISKLAGRREFPRPFVIAKLEKTWKAGRRFPNFTKVVYVRLGRRERGFAARPVLKETESMTVLTDSDGLVVVPERTTELRAGTEVHVWLLPGFSYVRGRFLAEE